MRTIHKVSELNGPLLDAAVAKAHGWPFRIACQPTILMTPVDCWILRDGKTDFEWAPSSNWAHGGPIIEREHIALEFLDGEWHAWSPGPLSGDGADSTGPTATIAAMRAFVANKFGETVELP